MKKNLVCLLATFLLFILHTTGFAAPSLQAESAILINAQTGGVIFEKNADARRAPASLTKMMTCVLGLEAKGLASTFHVSMAAAATEYSGLGLSDPFQQSPRPDRQMALYNGPGHGEDCGVRDEEQ